MPKDEELNLELLYPATTQTRQEFINAAEKTKETAGAFVDELQKEAGERFASTERDFWLSYQLIRAYMEAGLWPQAQEALQDAFLVTANVENDKWTKVFSELGKQIQEAMEDQ